MKGPNIFSLGFVKIIDTHILHYNSNFSNIKTVPTENNMFEIMQ